jgi:hypothetical protein
VPFEIQAARIARLDETIMSQLEQKGREIAFVVPGRGISTILIK